MTQPLEAALQAFEPALPLAVALSGGADSTALLVACADKWPGQVVAWHVNHGLQAAATRFEQHCQALCAELQVPLRIQRVDARHQPGQSPEDAARRARYEAFDTLAHTDTAQLAIKSVAIAQHADDQVETVVLALSRGSGLAGLSGMPAHWVRHGLDYYRPLLSVSAVDIRSWLLQRGTGFVEDPTNTDAQFTRNRIRAQILPALQSVFPHFRDTFARSAAHAAQAQELLDELAVLDWGQVERNGGSDPLIKPLQSLSRTRQANVLRHWLKRGYGVVPSAAQLAELLDQLAACTTRGHRIHIKVGDGFVERRAEMLAWYNPSVLLPKN